MTGKIRVAAGNLEVRNASQDVTAGVGELAVGPSATISGSLTYWSDQNADIAQEASISGEVIHNLPPDRGFDQNEMIAFFSALKTGFSVFNFLSLLLIGTLLAWLAPNYLKMVASKIPQRPWATLGIGFLVLILTPIIVGLLFLSLIGIPLALLALVLYIFLIYIAKVFVAIFIGQRVFGYLKKETSLIFIFLIGLIIVTALELIPVLGGIISLLITLFGLGAIMQAKLTSIKNLKKQKLL